MRVNREKIQRMVESNGSGSGGGGMSSAALESMLAMYATKQWVQTNFLTIEFFSKLFTIHGANNTTVDPNDMTTTIESVESMFGFWTQFYLSALGTGGQQTLGLRLSQLDDVSVGGVTNGQVLTWDASQGKWIAATPSSGVDMATVWAALAAQDASKKIDISHFPTLFTELSNTNDSPKKLSMTIGGTTKSIVVAYATAAGDAATIGGTAKGDLFSAMSSDWTTNLSVTIGGTTRTIPSICADYANRLRYSRTLWGQSFDGSANVSGNMTSVGNITMLSGDHSILTTNGNLILGYSNNEWVKVMDICSYNGSNYWNIHASGDAVFANVLSNGYVTALSDIRYKEVVNRFQLDVETIAKASLIQYKRKDLQDGILRVGGIAQEWQRILPEAVQESKEGRLSMDYGVIAFTSAVSLARSIQDQDKEISDLREKNAQLERRLQRLESMFAVDVD